MRSFLKRHWFLTTLAALIVAGLAGGLRGNTETVAPLVALVQPQWITAGVLFLMAFSLDSDRLWAAFRSPRPVILGYLLNYGFVPALTWLMMPMQASADFRFGLMIAASVPCTTAAASVMTRAAKGNDAVSLLTTLATNMSCFVVTPLWLSLTTGTQVQIPTGTLMLDLAEAVLVPTLAGQILRQPAPLKTLAVRYKVPIGIVAQVLIEVMVFTAALRAGTALHDLKVRSEGANTSRPAVTGGVEATSAPPYTTEIVTLESVVLVWGSCVAIHVTGLAVGWMVARRLGIPPADAAAVAFAGSQKTLPVGLLVSALFGPAYPFALFPMLLYHASQLFIDTAVAAWLARGLEPATALET